MRDLERTSIFLYELTVFAYTAATPLIFSAVRSAPSPSMPVKTGIISVRFAGAISSGWPASSIAVLTAASPIQFHAQATPHTQPMNGRQPETKTDGFAAST